MSLELCRECQKSISTDAHTCPNCGAPNPTLTKENKERVKYTFTNIPVPIVKAYRENLTNAFWIFYIGGLVIGNIFLLWADNGYFYYSWVGLVVLWNCFAIVAVWKSADEYKAASIVNKLGYGYATTAKVTTVIITLSGIGNALNK